MVVAPFSSQLLRINNGNYPPRGLNSELESLDPYQADNEAIVKVVEKTNPAVVNVGIYKKINTDNRLREIENLELPELPFEIPSTIPGTNRQSIGQGESELVQVGGGSGFIIDSNGLIVTNKHVVEDEASVYKVNLADGSEYDAKVLAKDPTLDVAIMKIDASNLPVLKLGNSDNIRLGQLVIAIGNTLAEYGNTVTRGIVSGIGRRVEAGAGIGVSELIEQAIQTDAAINPGNSGGPLLNIAGEVVGINTAVSRQGQLVGFSIPINNVKKTIESVVQTGRIIRPWLGIHYVPITAQFVQNNNLTVNYGVQVVRSSTGEAVIPGSPADLAGIKENDIILELNGKKLEDKDSLSIEIGRLNVGDSINLKVMRGEDTIEIKAKLAEFPIDGVQ